MQEKKERFHGIPMLPYGLLSAVMQESPGNRKEIQITKMAEEGFCFRTASAICSPQKLEVCFYDIQNLKSAERKKRIFLRSSLYGWSRKSIGGRCRNLCGSTVNISG